MPRSKKFDVKRIANNTGLLEMNFQRCKVQEDTLKDIYSDYQANRSMLEDIQKDIMYELNEKVMPHCHSIRSRLKDPDHLIGKIVRNAENKGGKYLTIDSVNYLSRINDLIGIRIVVLRQKDCKAVHEAILGLYENDPNKYISKDCDYDENINKYNGVYQAEQPIVYVTSKSDEKFYEDLKDLKIEYSKRTYRSIHYIIRKKEIFFEIQVRTLFEEGWLEFDHLIKYPADTNNPKKIEFLQILSGLAFAADELISFYDTVEPFMNKKKNSANDNKESIKSIEADSLNCTLDAETLEDIIYKRF